MEANGDNQIRLTDNPGIDRMPGFSPDGRQIVFVSNRHGFLEVYIMDRDSSNQTALTNSGAHHHSPVFSHDGQKIAYCSEKPTMPKSGSWTQNGTNQTNLTNNTAWDGSYWNPSLVSRKSPCPSSC